MQSHQPRTACTFVCVLPCFQIDNLRWVLAKYLIYYAMLSKIYFACFLADWILFLWSIINELSHEFHSETVIYVAGTQRKNVNILLLDWLFWTEPLGGQWGKYRQGGQQVSSTLLCTITLFPYLQQPVKILLRKFTFSLKTTVSVVVVKYG